MLTGRTGEATVTQAEAASQKRRLPFYLRGSDSCRRLHHRRQAARLVRNHGEMKANKDLRRSGREKASFGRCTLSVMVHFLEPFRRRDTEPSSDDELLMLAMMSQRFYSSKE